MNAENPRIFAGANNPPEITAFEIIKVHIDDLYAEAKLWLDGKPITTQKQANALNTLQTQIRKAANAADDLRKIEVLPLDAARAEIQNRFNELIGDTKFVKGKTVRAIGATKAALKPYLIALENEQTEAARIAKETADLEWEKAQELIAKRDHANLESIESAEIAITNAKESEQEAERISKQKSHAKGEGRATGLRSVYDVQLVSYRDAAAWAYLNKKEEFTAFLIETCNKEVKLGKRELPGFRITEERVV